MRALAKALCTLAAIAWATTAAWSATYAPVEWPVGELTDRYASNYDATLARIKAGDALHLPGFEHPWTVVGVNSGFTTKVVIAHPPAKRSGALAFRFPLKLGMFSSPNGNLVPYEAFLEKTRNGYRYLKDAGVQVPVMYRTPSRRYVAMSVVPHDFSLDRVLELGLIPQGAAGRNVRAGLHEFARSTAPFARIGDFHEKQVVLHTATGQAALLDWTNDHVWATPGDSRTVFDDVIGNLGEFLRVNKEYMAASEVASRARAIHLLSELRLSALVERRFREIGGLPLRSGCAAGNPDDNVRTVVGRLLLPDTEPGGRR